MNNFEEKVTYKRLKNTPYIVSDHGDILTFGKAKGGINIRKFTLTKGYVRGGFMIDGKPKNKDVHRIVAETFIPNPLGLREINHINRNKSDNRVNNLEWCTKRHNMNSVYTDGYSKYGISIKGKKWKAQIKINGKNTSLGSFSSKEEAYNCFYHAYKSHWGVPPWT